MAILIVSDLHLNDNDRDAYRHQFMRTLLGIIRKLKPTALLILGDLCDAKDRHGAWLVNQVVEHIDSCAFLCPVIILKGNHDYVDVDNPFFQFLRHMEGVTWINNPEDFATIYKERVDALFLPHTTNYKRDWAKLDFQRYESIFAHNTFDGADVGHGRRLSGIPTTIFPKGVRVIAGDIHIPQTLGPVTYVGAPYTVDFGDDYEPRLLLLDGKKLTSIPVEGPQKRLVVIKGDGTKAIEAAKAVGAVRGDILKVRVHISEDRASESWAERRDKIMIWGEQCGFIINSVLPVIDKQASTRRARSTIKTLTDEQVLTTYVKARGVDKSVVSTGQRLLRKV
jgi:hypothetical protein